MSANVNLDPYRKSGVSVIVKDALVAISVVEQLRCLRG
jgi:hypothetical protein